MFNLPPFIQIGMITATLYLLNRYVIKIYRMRYTQYLFIIFLFASCHTTQKTLTTPKYKGNILQCTITNNENDSLGVLSGELIDSTTREGISFAWIELLLSNSNVKKSIEADHYGKFYFNNIKPGNYSITVSYVGYYPFILQNIVITKGKMTFYKIELIWNSLLLRSS